MLPTFVLYYGLLHLLEQIVLATYTQFNLCGSFLVRQISKNAEGSKIVNGEKLKPAKVEELNPRKDFIYVEELKPLMDAEVKHTKDVNRKEVTPTVYADMNPGKDVVSIEELRSTKDAELKPRKDVVSSEELTSTRDAELKLRKDVISSDKLTSTTDAELKPLKDAVNSKELKPEKGIELNCEELQPTEDTGSNLMKEVESNKMTAVEELKLVIEIEEMKSKLNELESKLSEVSFLQNIFPVCSVKLHGQN